MEFNKEGLLLLAKKFSNQNYSLPKNLTIKTNQIPHTLIYHNSYINEINNLSSKDFLVNESEENINPQSKRAVKFKNKFLEKDNIQINEEKMLHLLSERKKKMKLTLSQGNKNRKQLRKNKIIYINIEKPSENNSNYINNNTSNSELFNNCSFISDRKSMKRIDKNIDLNLANSFRNKNASNYNKKSVINYSRNDDNNFNKNLVNQLYSTKRNNNRNMEEINEENIDNENDNNKDNINYNKNENRKNNNINNNININININNNINNNNNSNTLDNKTINKSPKSIKRFYKPNKFMSYIQNSKKINITDVNNIDNRSCANVDIKNKNINNSSEKVIKKYISHKIYYLKNKKGIKNNDGEIDEEDNINTIDNDNDNEYYKYINSTSKRGSAYERNGINPLNYKDYNTYNINVNFISGKENKSEKAKKVIKTYNSNDGRIMSMKPVQNNEIRESKNVIFYKSCDANNKIYTSEIVTKKDCNEDNGNINDNNITINNTESNVDATKKIMRKKIYKNKPSTIQNNNNNKTIVYHNYNNNNKINKSNIINNKKDVIHLEDLLILEGKFCHLLECIKFENPVPKICVEWWNFYTYCSYFGKFPKLFPKEIKEKKNYYMQSDYQTAHDAVMLELLSMIIIYKVLCDSRTSKNLINFLKQLINEIHQNFLIECDYILSRVGCNSMMNIWIQKLKNLILEKKNWEENFSEREDFHLNLLKQGNISIQNIIQYLIEQYSILNSNDIDINSLIYFNENITRIHLIELSGFFNKAINQENMKINKTFSYIIKKNINNHNKYISIVVPYLPEEIENKKKFTLVLDLDETLISFKFDEQRRGMLKMRPGLYNFLENVGKKYEIVIFTAGTQEYADPILDRIEKNGKIFAKRLYRQHAIFMNNIYLKDLTRLGRDLSKIIIVDNMPQNFSLQKENGILIKNYFGQDKFDTTLKDLTPILLKIASNPNNDVRKELKKYKEEIFTKITTNLRC